MKRKIWAVLSPLTLNILMASQELKEENNQEIYVAFTIPANLNKHHELYTICEVFNAEDTIMPEHVSKKYEKNQSAYYDKRINRAETPEDRYYFLPGTTFIFNSDQRQNASPYRSYTAFYKNPFHGCTWERYLVVNATSTPGHYSHEDRKKLEFPIRYDLSHAQRNMIINGKMTMVVDAEYCNMTEIHRSFIRSTN